MQQRSPRTPKKPRNRRRELLIAAKALIRKGYAILPLEAADPKRPGSGKRPITAQGVKDATKHYPEFKKMVKGLEDFNIGIVTGQINRIMVVDVDPRNGGDKTIRELITKHGNLPWSPKSRTGGGGTHRYFKVPKGMVSNGGKLGTGIDIKLDNGYVVAPPSGHASGKRYEWIDDRSLFDSKETELPADWLELLNANIAQKENQGERLLEAKAAQVPGGSSAMAGTAIPEGQRNTTLTSIAGRLRAAGRSVSDVETELKRINRERCQPSLDDGEVSKIAMSSERWAPAAGVGDPGLAERVREILFERHYAGGKHLRFERDGTFYHFAATHWGKSDATSVQKQVLAIIRQQFPGDRRRLMPVANEVMALLRVEAAGNDDALHFVTDPPQVINVLNGELWLLPDGQVDLRPHRPETGMRHVLPVTYDPDATSPQYDKAVAEIFSKAEFPNRMTKVWHQLMGYSIQPNRSRPTIVVLIGPGGDGKTKLVQTVARLVGSDAVYSGDVARLETSPFGIGGLVGKLLFIDDDVKAGARLPDGMSTPE